MKFHEILFLYSFLFLCTCIMKRKKDGLYDVIIIRMFAKHDAVAKKPLKILIWGFPYWNRKNRFKYKEIRCETFFKQCDCSFSFNISHYKNSDVIIFFHPNFRKDPTMISHISRSPKQIWIWYNIESPKYSPNIDFFNNKINLTMSYKITSDIFCPYGFLKSSQHINRFKIPMKRKLVAWVVSNYCEQPRKRIFELLRKFIDIDVFGIHHNQISSWQKYDGNFSGILRKYYFYLSFENSINSDYITEKLWKNAFDNFCIPVIVGPSRQNYELFIPSSSFIHVDDFSSIRELANFLFKITQNATLFQQYFQWRTHYEVVNFNAHQLFLWHYCRACNELRKLSLQDIINNINTKSLHKWYS